jgi:hypothetical protein
MAVRVRYAIAGVPGSPAARIAIDWIGCKPVERYFARPRDAVSLRGILILILADTIAQDAESAGQVGHARKPIEDRESLTRRTF